MASTRSPGCSRSARASLRGSSQVSVKWSRAPSGGSRLGVTGAALTAGSGFLDERDLVVERAVVQRRALVPRVRADGVGADPGGLGEQPQEGGAARVLLVQAEVQGGVAAALELAQRGQDQG